MLARIEVVRLRVMISIFSLGLGSTAVAEAPVQLLSTTLPAAVGFSSFSLNLLVLLDVRWRVKFFHTPVSIFLMERFEIIAERPEVCSRFFDFC